MSMMASEGLPTVKRVLSNIPSGSRSLSLKCMSCDEVAGPSGHGVRLFEPSHDGVMQFKLSELDFARKSGSIGSNPNWSNAAAGASSGFMGRDWSVGFAKVGSLATPPDFVGDAAASSLANSDGDLP